jgi:PAS domain S-box-containing protein
MFPPSALEQQQRDLLVSIARGVPLREVLERLVTLMELVTGDGCGSVLLLDPDGTHVRHGAAPHLPLEFIRIIDGSRIGPLEGSCGAAAYLKQRVIVKDIDTHPNWTHFKQFALPFGLRACWSTPLFSVAGDVLGTFAIYYREPRGPSLAELDAIELATHLASIALERERTQQALRASEQRYRQIYESVSDAIFHLNVDTDGRFRFAAVNPAFAAATGIAAENVVGQYVDDVIPKQAHDLVFQAYRTAIRERRTVMWQEVSDYPSGRRHGHVQVSPVFDSLGRCTHLVGTVHDVTAYILAAEKIAAQAALLDKAHDAISVLGLDGTVHYWNEGAQRLFELPATEAVGKRFSELLESEGALEQLLHTQLLRDGECSAELRRKTRSGVERTLISRSTLVRDEHGTPTSILRIETDITEHKRVEAEFHRVQRIESLGVLAGGIAHDFNNILSGILGHVDLAQSRAGGDVGVGDALKEIEKAAWRAAELTRRILTFGRKTDSAHAPTDLRVPLAEAAGLLQASIAPPISLRCNMEQGIPLVVADATAVHQVVMNLVTNAAHAIGARAGRIELELAPYQCHESRSLTLGTLTPGAYASIRVRDDGVGMDASTLERIFEPFFTTKVSQGSGLGLSVVHGIVVSHGGALQVESQPGRGSEFRVFLRALETTPAFGAEPISDVHDTPKGQNDLLLFVDDEEAIVALAKELLPPRGYRVEGFSNPLQALRAFESNPDAYSLLITDSAMHGMTGQQLVRAVRELRPQLPVVVSSNSSTSGSESFEALGVQEVLSKPVRFHHIAAAIERALKR